MVAFAAHALACVGFAQAAQQQTATPTPTPPVQQRFDPKNPTAEQVAETVIFAFGVRERIAQVRRTGIERGRITRATADGRTEEITYERSFKRGETLEKDKVRIDLKRPSAEYALVSNEGNIFGVVRGTPFTPREEEVNYLLSDRRHSLDALIRYKEAGSTLSLAGKETHKGIESWVLDLEDKQKKRTRFFISAKTYKVLWLEYEEAPPAGGAPVKFRRNFHEYRVVQGTAVPYRTVLLMGDRQLEEINILTVTYGVKLEDAAFSRPDSAANLP